MNFIELNANSVVKDSLITAAVNAIKDRGIWRTLFTNRFEYTIIQSYEEVKAILKSFEGK